MLKRVVLLNTFMESVIHLFQDSLVIQIFYRTAFIQTDIFCNINVFTVTLDQLNVYLL